MAYSLPIFCKFDITVSGMKSIEGVRSIQYASQLNDAGIAHYESHGGIPKPDPQGRIWHTGLVDNQYYRGVRAEVTLNNGSNHVLEGKNPQAIRNQIQTLLEAVPEPV